jgi:bifunctional oligoribonuclease and PAP phosphatase NrnA
LIILNKEKLNRFKDLISKSDNILLATHVNADGDAIGTSLAMALLLRKLGKNVNLVVPNDFPPFLQWIPGQEMITVFWSHEKKVKNLAKSAELLICLDFNDPRRLAGAQEAVFSSATPVVLIDHHPNPQAFADIEFSETYYGSASELLYNIILALGYEELIDKEIAEALFVGIMTDTGNFSFACSYPEVWNTVAHLLDYGLDKNEIFSKVYDNFSADRMRLMGYCLNEKMKIFPKYNTAIISLSKEEMKRFNHKSGDTEGFVNLPFSIKGIKFTALFIEKSDYIKISFRSRGNFSVNEFSMKNFRGGGHVNAAGGEWDKPLDKVIERFESLLPDYRSELG